MEKKKIGLIVLAVLVVTALYTAPAGAAYAWYTCEVVQAGPGGNTVYVMLTDTGGAFTDKWFQAYSSAMANAQLATALTALTTGQQVYVRADAVPSTGSLFAIYLLPLP